MKPSRVAYALAVAASACGCASQPEAPAAAPGSPEHQAQVCREQAQRAEQIIYSPKIFRTNGDPSFSLTRGPDPYAFVRCMQAAGHKGD